MLDGRGGWGVRWRGGERSEVQGREGVLQLHITNQPGRESVTSFSPKRHFKNAPCTELCIAKKKTGIRIDGVQVALGPPLDLFSCNSTSPFFSCECCFSFSVYQVLCSLSSSASALILITINSAPADKRLLDKGVNL